MAGWGSVSGGHRTGVLIASILVGLGLGALATQAEAGPPGKWTRVTSEPQPSNTREIGLERTPDGVLHVLWTRDSGATEQVMHRSISAGAKALSANHQLISTPNAVNPSVDLLPRPGGSIRALFSGIFPGSPLPGGYSTVMATTTSSDGASWTPINAASNNQSGSNSPVYAAAGIGGALASNGTPMSIWGDSSPSGGGFHLGLDGTDADGDLGSACCERDPNIAVDSATGVFAFGWNFVGAGSQPNALQVVQPLVTPVLTAPGSRATWLQQRVGLSGRIGAGGIYAAYGFGANPFDARPALWRFGAAKAKVVKQPRDAEHTTLAPAPSGRIWVAWEGKDRGNRLFATRTNPKASRFGAVVSVKPPKGTDAVHRLNVEGSRGYLDLLALVNRGGGDISYWHQRLLPGLTLTAKPKKVAAGKRVAFKVSDAGQAVKGAKVTLKLGGKQLSKKTKASGKAKMKVPAKTKPGRYAAAARKGGYAGTKRKLRVK